MRWSSAIETDTNLKVAVEQAADRVFAGLDRQQPDLLIAFVSAHYAAQYEDLPALLRREFDNAYIFGCCADGVIGGGRELEHVPALSLTGAVLPGVTFKGTHLDAAQTPGAYAETRVWEDALRLTANQQPSFLVLADPLSFETDAFLKGLDRTYPLATKIGGLASGARQVGGAALFLGDRMYRSGCITLALTGDVEIDAVVAQGCRPIGDPVFVTAAHDNLIRELDGRAPRDVISELFEKMSTADRDLIGDALFLGLAIRRDASELAHGDFLIRNILGMDPQSGALWVNATIPPNSVVQFHVRDAETSVQDLERTLTAYRASHRPPPPDAGALLFSCAGRGLELYGQTDHDSNAFRRLVADVPIGGFFCDGEIGPVHNATYLHGYTTAFAVFRPRS